MKTKVHHIGEERHWEGLINQWNAHSEQIIAWCDGAEIEYFNHHSGRFCQMHKSDFFSAWDRYRIAQRKPQAGEVWYCKPYDDYCLAIARSDGGVDWQSLDGKKSYVACTITYAAPSVEAYIASKLHKQSVAKDSGFEYDDANKLLEIVKKAAGVE